MPFSRTLTSIPVALLVIVAACTDDEASGNPSTPSDGGSEGSTPSSADGSTGAPDAATDSPPSGGGNGIELTAGGTAYSLKDNPSAAQAGNGWMIGAAKVDGTKMRNLTIILNKAEADSNGTKYVPLTPDTYPCTAPGAPPFNWARLQYVTPDQTSYQSGSATCSVTLTEFGAVGQPIKGSFSATLERIGGTEPNPVQISGTFDVVRKN